MAYDLHKCAVDAEQSLEKLATELAKAQAPDNVTNTVTKMADVARQIVKVVGSAQPEEAAPAEAPPPEEAQPRSVGEAVDQMPMPGR
jgi:hypothetical protein